jgi:hypothetical protein
LQPELAIETIEDLVQHLDLLDVTFLEERGRVVQRSDEEKSEKEWPLHVNRMSVTQSKDKTGMRFRFRYVFSDMNAEYVADARVEYVSQAPFTVPEDVKLDYASRVAFMTAYPFIRSSIFGSATRLTQEVPVLGLVRQGEFEVGSAMSDDEVREAFFDNKPELN